MINHLGDRLRNSLDSKELDLLRLVAHAAESLHMALYAVGGLPRDLILERPAHDIDLVVEGDAIELARWLAANSGGSVIAHQRFGTATWSRKPPSERAHGSELDLTATVSVDLAAARTEIYRRPAQLPRVSPETIVADLRRRDFTINAIAIRLDGRHFGEVLDPLGGRDDLRGKRINVLHKRSFVDDPTRMYRAVRYEQRLGFRIGRATLALLREGGSWVPAVSGQRLRRELDLILMEKPKAASLRRLSKLGLLRPIHRALPADPRCLRRLGSWYAHDDAQALLRPASNELWLTWMQWLMDVRPAALRAIGHRLVLDRKEMESILAAAELYRTARTWVHWRPSELTGQLDGIPQIAVDAVHAVLPQGKARRMLGQYLHSWRHIRTHASGRDLHDRGLTPGPRYRSILEALRAAWIDGAVQNANEESLLLERLIGRAPARARRNRGNGRVRSALKR